jgi:ferritin
MLNEKMQEALNGQMNAELYSSYLYLSMASYFEDSDLSGFGSWMKVQAQEELYHGLKFYDYINGRGGRAIMAPIEGPATEWESPLAAFETVLAHEQKVTGLINGLVDLSIELKDHATNNFLQWFVAEQVEEEASASEVLNKLKLIRGEGQGMLMLDTELAGRPPLFVFPGQAGGE